VADLSLSKVASTATPNAGGTLTYTLVLSNAGPSTATNATFADNLPTGLGTLSNVTSAVGGGASTGSFNITSSALNGTVTLPPGGAITVSFQASVSGTASGTIANVATVSTPPGTTDTTPGNNTGTATITVGLVADLSLSKVASTATPNAGGTLTYTLVLSNAGPSTATNATFADNLPTGLGTLSNVTSAVGGGASTGSFNITSSALNGTVTLPPGGAITVSFQASVSGTASGTIANVATVSTPPGTTDTTPGNNTGTATITVGLVADLSLSKVASTATPNAGGTLTYTLVLSNAGPSTATNATFADNLPTGLGTLSNVTSAVGGGASTGSFNITSSALNGTVTLPPGGAITVSFQASVSGTASGTIANVATVSTPPGTTDTTPGNNTGTATITVGLVADLSLSKVASTATPNAGGTLTYTLVLSNAGPSTATNATFADNLPTGLGTLSNVTSAVGGGASTGSFNITSSALNGTVTLPPGGAITVSFQASVSGTASGTIANVATVSTPPGTTDTTPGNNTGTATITVGLVADLSLSKVASTATPNAGGTLTYTLVLSNAGPSTATNATFADNLPTGLGTLSNVTSAVGGGASTGSFNITSSALNGTVTLPPGGAITVSFQASVSGTASGTIANVATVSTPPGTTDTTPGNNTGTATITVGLVADLSLSKVASTATPNAGGTLTYTLVLSNAGPSTATNATFADNLPTGLGTLSNVTSAVGGGASTGSFNITSSALNGTVTLPPGGAITVSFQASVSGTASGTIANVATVSTPPGTTDTTPGNNTGTATITVGLVADLSLSKVASTATPNAGGTLTYTLVLSNAGPSTATNATFADNLPTGLGTLSNVTSAVGGGASTGSFNITSSALNGTVTLPPGGAITVSFQASVSGTASGTIANVATISTPPGTTDTTPGNNTGTATITVGLVADLSLSKVASTATPNAGGTLTYTLVLSNAGPSTATNATFADNLPTGLGTLSNVTSAVGGGASTGSFNITSSALNGTVTLPPGGAITVSFQASVSGTASGTIANVATVSTPPGTTDTTPGNNTGTATITVGLVADLSLSKVASTATPNAGGTLTYTLVLSNAGPSTATNATFADNLPTGLGTLSNVTSAVGGGASTGSFNITSSALNGTVTLPPGGAITVSFQASVSGTASGTIANVATVSTPPGTTDTTPGNNTGTATITVGLVADLSLSKVASTATPNAGGTLTYTLVLSNAGPSTATNATFADNLPTGLGTLSNVTSAVGGGASTGSFNITSSALNGTVTLPPGGAITVSFQASVSGTASGTIANVATVSTPPGTTDTTPGNNTGTATITVGLVADLSLSKVASTATPNAGGTLTYTLVLSNAGPSTATNATFADNLPTGLGTLSNVTSAVGGGASTGSFNITSSALNGTVTLPPGGAITVSFQASVSGTASGTIANVATVSTPPGTTDTTPGNNTGTATITVGLVADLSLSKVASTATPNAGGTLTYTLVLSNAGPSTATNATFADNLPTGLGTLSNVTSAVGGGASTGSFNITSSALNGTVTLPPGGAITVSFQASVSGTASGTIANVATVSTPPGTTDTTPGNNTGTATITVGLVADLSLSKTASQPNGNTASGTMSFALVVVNAGPSTAANITVSDVVPAGLNVLSVSGAGLSGANVGNVVSGTAISLASGATATLTIVVSMSNTTSGTLGYTNTASVTSTTPDPTPTNNTSTTTVTVAPLADVATVVSLPANATAGSVVTGTVSYTNNGTSTAANVTGSVVVGTAGGTITTSNTGNTTTLSLVPGASIQLTFTFTVPASNVTATSTVTTTTADANSANDTRTSSTSVNAVADLTLTKVASNISATQGQTISYTVTLVNLGPSTAQNVTVSDILSAGLTLISASGNNGTTTVAGASVGATTASLSVGQTLTLVVNATVTASTGNITNTAVGTSTTPDPTPTNTVTVVTPVAIFSDVSTTIQLTPSGLPGSVQIGTVTFYNLGVSIASNATRTLALGGGTLTALTGGTIAAGSVTATFSVIDMAPGGTTSFTFTYQMPTSGVVSATSTITTTTADPNLLNNLATTLSVVSGVGVDLSVTLAVSPTLLVAGSNTVTVTVHNVGTSQSTGTLHVSLPPSLVSPTSVTFNVGGLAPGQSVQFTTTYVLPALTTTSRTFTATVIAGTGVEVNLTNNTSTLVVGIGARVAGRAWIENLRNRTYDAGETLLPNLLVKLKNAGSVVVGTAMTSASDDPLKRGRYEIIGVPAGNGYSLEFFSCVNPSDQSTCVVIGTTPINGTTTTEFGQASTGTTTMALSVGGTQVGQAITGITLYAGDNTIDQNLPIDPSGVVYDSVTRLPLAGATVKLIGPDGLGVAAANIVGGVNTVVTGVNGFYQFWLQGMGPANSGTYTLVITPPAGYSPATVTNTSFAVLNNVVPPSLLSPVPAALTSVQAQGSAPPSGQRTDYHVQMVYNFAGAVGDVINNHIPLDLIASLPVAAPAIDLLINKLGPATMVGGGTGTYTLSITNTGASAASNVTVTDAMPAGLALLSASVVPATAFGLNVSPTGLIAQANSLAVGTSVITLVVRAELTAVGSTITNIASVATTTTESNTVNNVSSAVTRVLGADMGVVKAGPANLVAGGTASYTLTVFNAGPSAAANVTVTDILPAGLSLKSATVRSGSFSLITTTGALTAVVPSMGVGTAVIELTVEVDHLVVGSVTNVAGVTSTTSDIDPSNNTSTVTSGVLGADLSLAKYGAATLSAAGTSTYTLVLVNNGPSSAGNVQLSDLMPKGLSLISASAVASDPGLNFALNATATGINATASFMRSGGTVTVTLSVQVDYTATGSITNIATVTSTTADPEPGNNTGSATASVKEVEPGVILVNKTGNKTVAELGDSVQYTIRLRNTVGVPVVGVTLEDLLPAGFRYIPGTARLGGVVTPDPVGGVGRQLDFAIGTIPGGSVAELTYFVRLGVGSQQGDGVNRATAIFAGARGVPVRSNTAIFKVIVQGGVFSNEGCIAGKVYMDCDGNSAQNNVGGSQEMGIPGVRLVLLDGSFIVTDNEGKYSLCGVKPQTHVLKVDRTTLPKGARLLPSSNRNAGVGDSIFVEMRGGELARADFIEGSCSPDVIEQVKARRAQGGASLPQPDRTLEPLVPTAGVPR
jgi:uncharacterized repeat protein (TIGR01451 family)